MAAVDGLPAEMTVLLDAYDPVRRGGTGQRIDWSVAAAAAARRPMILSGGLTPDNVQEAVRVVKPLCRRCVVRCRVVAGCQRRIEAAGVLRRAAVRGVVIDKS